MLCSMLIEWHPRPDVVVEVPADHQQGVHVVLLDLRLTHQVFLESRKEDDDLLTVVGEGLGRQRKHRIQVDGLQPFTISKVLDAEGYPTLLLSNNRCSSCAFRRLGSTTAQPAVQMSLGESWSVWFGSMLSLLWSEAQNHGVEPFFGEMRHSMQPWLTR